MGLKPDVMTSKYDKLQNQLTFSVTQIGNFLNSDKVFG